ncbi:MAG: thioredoxin family protein [Candidatus Diapherotrites archaeon]|nr:thioredoxin family protein [Candidatus Diapherotrites archaeon]
MTEILLLSTPGCASCVIAKKMLERLAKEMPLHITEINVMNRPDLLGKYGFGSMPGIIIDGKLAFSGAPGEPELRERLIKEESTEH